MAQDPNIEDRARQDEWLVVRSQLGERPAFDALIERWHAPLWRYVRQLTPHDDVAQEIAQEVWLRVIRGISRLRDGAKVRAWLFGIARRVLIKRAIRHPADSRDRDRRRPGRRHLLRRELEARGDLFEDEHDIA